MATAFATATAHQSQEKQQEVAKELAAAGALETHSEPDSDDEIQAPVDDARLSRDVVTAWGEMRSPKKATSKKGGNKPTAVKWARVIKTTEFTTPPVVEETNKRIMKHTQDVVEFFTTEANRKHYRKTLREWVLSVAARLFCPVSVYPTEKKKNKTRVGCGNSSLSLSTRGGCPQRGPSTW